MKSIAKNYVFNLIYQMLAIIIPLVTTPYLSRVLGVDKIGEYSFAQSIVAYFSMFATMGTALYGQRKMAECLAKGEETKKSFIEIVILRSIFVGVSLLAFYSFILPGVSNKILYLFASIEIVSVAFDISWFFHGIEEFHILTVLSGVCKLVGTIFIFICVNSRDDLNVYVICYCGSILVCNLLQWIFVGKYIKKETTFGKLNVSQHIKPAVMLFISQLAIQLYTVLDKTMIGVITHSNYENGYYEQSQKLIKAIIVLVTSLGTVMASRIAIIWNGNSKDKYKEIRDLMTFSFRFLFCIGMPIMFGTMVIAARFVPIYYGSGYKPVIKMIQCLAIMIPVIGASNIVGMQLLVPSNRENLLTKSVIMGAISNILLNMFLVAKFSALGACIASVVAECVVTGTQIYLVRKELDLRKIATLMMKYLGYAGGMFATGYLVSQWVSDGIFSLFVIVLVCMVFYGLIMLFTKDPLVLFVMNKIKSFVMGDSDSNVSI